MSIELFEKRNVCNDDKHSFGDWNVMPYWDNCEPNNLFEEEIYYVKYFRQCSICGYEESRLVEVSGYEEQQKRIESFNQSQQAKRLRKIRVNTN